MSVDGILNKEFYEGVSEDGMPSFHAVACRRREMVIRSLSGSCEDRESVGFAHVLGG